MHRLRHLRNIIVCSIIQRQGCETVLDKIRCEVSNGNVLRALSATACIHEESTAKPLRSTKPKSKNDTLQYFVDIKSVRTLLYEIYYQFVAILSIYNIFVR